jgi:hypothetical protein
MLEADERQRAGAGPNTAPYPPEPWHLGGHLLISAFRVPLADLPDGLLAAVPPGHRALTAGGRLPVLAAFAHYRSGGVLAYEELLVDFPVVAGRAVRFTIPRIWVTSEASRRGGRELWGIPKDLAEIERTRARTTAAIDGREIASLDARVGRRLWPGSPRVPLPTAQQLDGRSFVSRNTVFATVRALDATWRFGGDGPLGFLAGRTPSFSLVLDDAAIVFGRDVERR